MAKPIPKGNAGSLTEGGNVGDRDRTASMGAGVGKPRKTQDSKATTCRVLCQRPIRLASLLEPLSSAPQEGQMPQEGNDTLVGPQRSLNGL